MKVNVGMDAIRDIWPTLKEGRGYSSVLEIYTLKRSRAFEVT